MLGIGRFAGPNAWTPADIGGCVLWLRADLGVTKNVSTNIVSSWLNQAGNRTPLTVVPTCTGPLWAASVIGGQNGMVFNGSSTMLVSTLNVWAQNATKTVVLVMKIDATDKTMMCSRGRDGYYHTFEAYNLGGGAYIIQSDCVAVNAQADLGTDDITASCYARWDYTAGTPNLTQFWLNGDEKDVTSNLTTEDSAEAYIVVGGRGKSDGPVGSYFNGKLCEIIGLAGKISSDNWSILQAYINTRYGL